MNNNLLNKPKTFVITGNTFVLSAIWKQLRNLGYTGIDEEGLSIEMISESTDYLSSLDSFKHLYSGSQTFFTYNSAVATFTVPEEYYEALAFAEDQLENPYWGKGNAPFMENDWVVCTSNQSGRWRQVGDIFQISSSEDEGGYVCITDGQVILTSRIRHATTSEINGVLEAKTKRKEIYQFIKEKFPKSIVSHYDHQIVITM
ncbi:MAG: hypothetical protein ACOH2V_01045 [Candidatus Saccharimonadaceae bacterium]